MGRLTAKEIMEIKGYEKEIATLRARLAGSHDPAQDRYINAEIRMKEQQIHLIKERPAIREREEEYERAQLIRWLALCKSDGVDLGSFEEEWKKILPEAKEKGWLKKYGSQVDIWLIEIKHKRTKRGRTG